MDRGSKFLAYAFPVSSETEAQSALTKVKKEHPKARHYCTALRLNPDGSFERSSDDGEPSGSAGKPILGQIIRLGLTNVFIVVVRYFGGTKLGVPGLIEAYKTSAANALNTGQVIHRTVFTKVRVVLPYDIYPSFHNHIKKAGLKFLEETHGEQAMVVIGLEKSKANEILLATLQAFSKMDFTKMEDYASHLNIQVDFLGQEVIV